MSESRQPDTAEFLAAKDLQAKHFGPSPPPVAVTFGALSHPGLVRENNEDHYMVVERRRTRAVLLSNLPDGLLPPADDVSYVMAVADGMGGAAVGEVASMLALRSGWDQGPSSVKWTWVITDREVEDLKERIELVFRRMDRTLMEVGKAGPQYRGMGTTLTAAYTVGPEAFIGHVGDSRAYLYHDGALTRLTRDQTLAQDALDVGLPVLRRSWHHALTGCLGGKEKDLHVEFHHVGLADGDQLLLCTDGLTDMLTDRDITAVLAQDLPPPEVAGALVDRALWHGGRDNVTVIVARYAVR
jgi:protein phosphatase